MNWKFWKKDEKKFTQVLDWRKQCFKINGKIFIFYGDVFKDKEGKYYDQDGMPIEYVEARIFDPFQTKHIFYKTGVKKVNVYLSELDGEHDYITLIYDRQEEFKKYAEELKKKFHDLKPGTYSHRNWENTLDRFYNVTLLKKYKDDEDNLYVSLKFSDIFGKQAQEREEEMNIDLFLLFEDNFHNEVKEIE